MRTFDPARVAVVDSHNGSVLARGPFPVTSSGDFAYSGILQKVGTGPTPHFSSIVVISLIDCTGEADMLRAELSTFGLPLLWEPSYWPPYERPDYDPRAAHGSGLRAEDGVSYPGSLSWWPIEGLSADQDPGPFLGSPGYDLDGLVNHVRDLLTDPDSRVVYFHCSLGADRTGALAACYAIRHMGMDLTKALDFVSRATPAGPPNADYVRLIEEFWMQEAVRRSARP